MLQLLQNNDQDNNHQDETNRDNQKIFKKIHEDANRAEQEDNKTKQDDKQIEQDNKKNVQAHSVQKRPAFSSKNLCSNTNWWKWLTTLDSQRVKITQNICKDMMKLMGYTEIQTNKDVNPTSLTTSFCLNQDITFCKPA